MQTADIGTRISTSGARLAAPNTVSSIWLAVSRRLGFVATAIAILHPGAEVLAGEELNFCYEMADVRPWRTASGTGLNFQLIDSAARHVGIVIKYHGLPWKRCLSELKSSGMDGALAASFKEDRLEIGVFPGGKTPDPGKRLHMDRYVVLRGKGSSVHWDGKAFSRLEGPVGIQLGYSIGDQLRSMNVAVDDGSLTMRELLLKLTAGRLGAAAVLSSEIGHLAKQDAELVSRVDILPRPLVEKPYFLMLSHKFVAANRGLADKLWQAIEATRNSPQYRKLEKDASDGPHS